ncbi:MAG: hypothetical protein FJ399_02905 [Verrucomicrobia bacterium]|nr:hypothetical protein [Verrucomicrobiota bacterium]
MKPLPYFVGVAISCLMLFFTYTDGGYHSAGSFYVAAIASSYILYSSIAIVVTRYGKSPQTRAWLFFGCGVALMFAFIPAFRLVIELFYVPMRHGSEDAPLPVRELFFFGPVIIGALCIFRSFVLWSDTGSEKKEADPAGTDNDRAAPGRV